jgi:hypothetical protein
MALSHHEQRALEQIAVDLCADDPRLASVLVRGYAATRRRQRMAAAVMFVAGMTMQASAILIPRSIAGGVFGVTVLGYVVMFSAALVWCKGPSRRWRHTTFPTGSVARET